MKKIILLSLVFIGVPLWAINHKITVRNSTDVDVTFEAAFKGAGVCSDKMFIVPKGQTVTVGVRECCMAKYIVTADQLAGLDRDLARAAGPVRGVFKCKSNTFDITKKQDGKITVNQGRKILEPY